MASRSISSTTPGAIPPASSAPLGSSGSSGNDTLPVRKKAFYGIGGYTINFCPNAFASLAYPIYNMTLKLDPGLIGMVIGWLALARGFLEPAVGHWSDRCQSRWGRRRPFLVAGSVLIAVLFAATWWFPRGQSETWYIVYLTLSSTLFYGAMTIYTVPYMALGVELSNDYNERTSVMAYRAFFTKFAGLSAVWLFPLAQLGVFQDTIEGIRWVSLVVSIVLLASALVPAFLSERPTVPIAQRPPSVGFLKGLKVLSGSRAFWILGLVRMLTIATLGLVVGFEIYVNTYYVFAGDAKAGASMTAVRQSVHAFVSIGAIPCIYWVAHRLGKTRTLALSLGLIVVAAASKWFLYTPLMPYLQLIAGAIYAPAHAAYFVLLDSMTADLVDDDELRSGERREGLITATSGWLMLCPVSSSSG